MGQKLFFLGGRTGQQNCVGQEKIINLPRSEEILKELYFCKKMFDPLQVGGSKKNWGRSGQNDLPVIPLSNRGAMAMASGAELRGKHVLYS